MIIEGKGKQTIFIFQQWATENSETCGTSCLYTHNFNLNKSVKHWVCFIAQDTSRYSTAFQKTHLVLPFAMWKQGSVQISSNLVQRLNRNGDFFASAVTADILKWLIWLVLHAVYLIDPSKICYHLRQETAEQDGMHLALNCSSLHFRGYFSTHQ